MNTFFKAFFIAIVLVVGFVFSFFLVAVLWNEVHPVAAIALGAVVVSSVIAGAYSLGRF